MTTAAIVAYAYDQIDQAPSGAGSGLEIDVIRESRNLVAETTGDLDHVHD